MTGIKPIGQSPKHGSTRWCTQSLGEAWGYSDPSVWPPADLSCLWLMGLRALRPAGNLIHTYIILLKVCISLYQSSFHEFMAYHGIFHDIKEHTSLNHTPNNPKKNKEGNCPHLPNISKDPQTMFTQQTSHPQRPVTPWWRLRFAQKARARFAPLGLLRQNPRPRSKHPKPGLPETPRARQPGSMGKLAPLKASQTLGFKEQKWWYDGKYRWAIWRLSGKFIERYGNPWVSAPESDMHMVFHLPNMFCFECRRKLIGWLTISWQFCLFNQGVFPLSKKHAGYNFWKFPNDHPSGFVLKLGFKPPSEAWFSHLYQGTCSGYFSEKGSHKTHLTNKHKKSIIFSTKLVVIFACVSAKQLGQCGFDFK